MMLQSLELNFMILKEKQQLSMASDKQHTAETKK